MRKSILSLIFSALVATMGFTTSSNAIGLEGLGVGFSIGTAGYYAVGEEQTDNIKTGEAAASKAGAFQNDIGSIFVEYTAGPITFGLDYALEDITTPSATNAQWTSDTNFAALTNTVKATFENHTTFYASIPVFHALYAKVGVIYVDITTQEKLGTGGEYGNTDTTGITAGLGLSREIQDGVHIRAEALFAQYDDVKLTNSKNTTTSVNVTDMMGASGRVSIVKVF